MGDSASLTDGCFLGFDFGTKSIGVAVGQLLTSTARPLQSINYAGGALPWYKIKALINEWLPVGLVVGMPLSMDGGSQFITHASQDFANQLERRFLLPVHYMDERLTSVAAKDYLVNQLGRKSITKADIDKYAAKILLHDWLICQRGVY